MSACRVVTNAIGKPVVRCKHQTATVGSNPMLSANQSALRSCCRDCSEKGPRNGAFLSSNDHWRTGPGGPRARQFARFLRDVMVEWSFVVHRRSEIRQRALPPIVGICVALPLIITSRRRSGVRYCPGHILLACHRVQRALIRLRSGGCRSLTTRSDQTRLSRRHDCLS